MTSLRGWRALARNLILLGCAWEVVGAVAALIVVILAVVGIGSGPTVERLVSAVGTLGLAGVVGWAIVAARRRTTARLARRALCPGPSPTVRCPLYRGGGTRR